MHRFNEKIRKLQKEVCVFIYLFWRSLWEKLEQLPRGALDAIPLTMYVSEKVGCYLTCNAIACSCTTCT